MLEKHFIAATNIPHVYYPDLARSAIAYTYATKLPQTAINDLVAATPKEMNIDGHTMRQIVYHSIASKLDPSHSLFVGDMQPDEWGDLNYVAPSEYGSNDVNMEDMQQHLQNAMFSRRKAIEPSYNEPLPDTPSVGRLDPSRVAHLEQLRRHGNLSEAIYADDMNMPVYGPEPEPTYNEPSFTVPTAPAAPSFDSTPVYESLPFYGPVYEPQPSDNAPTAPSLESTPVYESLPFYGPVYEPQPTYTAPTAPSIDETPVANEPALFTNPSITLPSYSAPSIMDEPTSYDVQPILFPEIHASAAEPSAAANATVNDIEQITESKPVDLSEQKSEIQEIYDVNPIAPGATFTTPAADTFVTEETPMEAAQDAVEKDVEEQSKILMKEQKVEKDVAHLEQEKKEIAAENPATAEEQLENADKQAQLAREEEKKRDKLQALEEKRKRTMQRTSTMKNILFNATNEIKAIQEKTDLSEQEKKNAITKVTNELDDKREQQDLENDVEKAEERTKTLQKKEETKKKEIAEDEQKRKNIATREAALKQQPASPAKEKEKASIERQKEATTVRIEQNKQKLAELEEKKKKNEERLEKAGDALSKFMKRTRAEVKAIDKETGFSKRAKEETTKTLNEAIDVGFDKATQHVERKLDSSKIADAIIGEAAKSDAVWREIAAADRAKLIDETEKQTDSMLKQFEAKEEADTAQVDSLVNTKQISDKTGNRIKQLLARQNTAALNVAIKSFAHNAGQKLGLTSKKFSVLLRELNVHGGKFEKILEEKIRQYAPKVKETLRELTKESGVVFREANRILGPVIKEWLPIIMEQANKAGSAITTEVINQIPNIVAMVVKTASKSGKSAIGADMDSDDATLVKPLHTQWQQGSVVFEEIVPTDPPGGIYAFPQALDAGDVARHLAVMSKEPGKSAVFWTIYMRLYTYITQMSRENDDWFKWASEHAPLFLGANPITLNMSGEMSSPSAIAWVHSFSGVPFTSHNVDSLRTFIELLMRACVSLSDDCKMHARILMRTPAAGIGYENLNLL